MSELFLRILNMSISASWVVGAVLILRLMFKKAPKWIAVLLWGIVAVRLICPFAVESAVSLIPSAQTIDPEIMLEQTPQIHTGISMLNSTINPIIQESTVEVSPEKEQNTFLLMIPILAGVWLAGVAGMLLYGVVSYWRVKRKVATAVLLRERVYCSEAVISPFVLGLLKPKIYLPFQMDAGDMEYVIAHERAHIRRMDTLWKPLGFLLLTFHWFNPLMWLGYVLLCRDIELACDEKVVKGLDIQQRADYSQALLSCSVNRRMIAACPVAFGEVSVKDRVKSVLSYKKPAFWIILVAIVASIVLAVCFLTDPKTPQVDSTEPNDLGEPVNVITQEEIDRLRVKYPQYFDLDTTKGLEVYVWQMAENSYNWGLLPGRNRNYTHQELWDLHKTPATLEEMQIIVASYIPEISMDSVTVIPITMPHSSYAYKIDAQYYQKVKQMFWTRFPILGASSYVGYIDAATFDIDGDGIQEKCTLGYGPTSGLFTVTLRVQENGEKEYFNIFMLDHGDLSFAHTDSGWKLKLIPSLGDLEVIYYTFSVRNGNIVLTANGEEAAYWGEQGASSPWYDFQMAEDGTILSVTSYPSYRQVYEQTPTDQVAEKYDKGDFVITKTHYQIEEGIWAADGYCYLYRLEVTGRMRASEKNCTYIVLANRKDITFDEAWQASGISSNLNDYFAVGDAVIVGKKLF